MPHDLRDVVVDFLGHYRALTGIARVRLLGWLTLSPRKLNRWKGRYGKANERNAMIPRDHWIEPHERSAIEKFARPAVARPPAGVLRSLFEFFPDRCPLPPPGLHAKRKLRQCMRQACPEHKQKWI